MALCQEGRLRRAKLTLQGKRAQRGIKGGIRNTLVPENLWNSEFVNPENVGARACCILNISSKHYRGLAQARGKISGNNEPNWPKAYRKV